MQQWILVELVQRANIQTLTLKRATSAQLAMCVLVRQKMVAEVLILADPRLLTITWVTNALRATIVLQDLTSPLSVHLAPIMLKKAKRGKNNVFCANLVPSRMNGAKKAAKCADSMLIHQKEPLFATVSERTELILLETLLAAARVASTISTIQISRRVLSVTSPIVSH